MELDDAPRQREPETGARGARREERIEDSCFLSRRQTGAVIADREHERSVVRKDARFGWLIRRRRLYRVAQKIREHRVAEPALVEIPTVRRARRVDRDRGTRQIDGARAEQRSRVDATKVDRSRPREVEEIVREYFEALRFVDDAVRLSLVGVPSGSFSASSCACPLSDARGLRIS